MISRDTYIELTKFAIVGSLCFGLDLVLYYTLTEYFGAPTFLGKSIGVISATFLNYYLNKTWTWGQNNKDTKRFAKYMALYFVSGLLNVVSNEIFFNIFPKNEFQMLIIDPQALLQKPFLTIKLNKLFAVLGATIVGMVVNYIGQKLWVFKEDTSADK